MEIEIFASQVSDNYFYALLTPGSRVIWIDPIDGAQAVEWTREQGLEVHAVVNTHFHHDHIGGNDEVLKAFPEAQLWAGSQEVKHIEAHQARDVDRRLAGGEEITVDGASFQVLDTPGHTAGHISLLVGKELFSGDTLFMAGVGNCNFGGDVGVMYRTFHEVICQLDRDVAFYPGHDYAIRNLEFAISVDPDNKRAAQLLTDAILDTKRAELRGQRRALEPRTLGEERHYNPFFRLNNPRFLARVQIDYPEIFEEESAHSHSPMEAGFRTLRTLRDQW